MSATMDIDFYGKGNPVLEAGFAGCVRWAWTNPETREAFERETGMRLATDPMGAMIDEATGYEHVIGEAFVRWVAENLWGGE